MSYGYGSYGGGFGGYGGGYGDYGGGFGRFGGYNNFRSSLSRYQDSIADHPRSNHPRNHNRYRNFNYFQNAHDYLDPEYSLDDVSESSFGSALADTGDWDAPEVDLWNVRSADALTQRSLRHVPGVVFDILDDDWVDSQRVVGHDRMPRGWRDV